MRMGKLGPHRTDCEWILSQIKNQEKELRLKRRWLLGLSTSKSERKQLKRPKIPKSRSLPESLLREDDIFYETIRTSVEEALRAHNVGKRHHVGENNIKLLDLPNIRRVILSCLNDFTNKGLYLLALILTEGSIDFEKTRPKMKKIIKESLPKVFENKVDNCNLVEISTKLSQFLNDPQHFQENCEIFLALTLRTQLATCTKILDKLEDLPCQTLIAMHRKLRGVQGFKPQLYPRRHGWNRDILIKQVRNTSEEMLAELGLGDELPEPLKKALTVANLSLKLMLAGQDFSLTEFIQLLPETKLLQNEISKAIWSLQFQKTIRSRELKRLQHMLDPNAEVPIRSLRSAIKKMLTEYLFECGDMDTIPKSLSKTLAVINRGSRIIQPRGSKEEIEQETECILCVSAQTKQIVWDFLPDIEFDQDYTDAYMEELVESCESDHYSEVDIDDYSGGEDQQSENRSSESRSHSYMESNGESIPIDFEPTISSTNVDCSSPIISADRNLNSHSADIPELEHFNEFNFAAAHGTSVSPNRRLDFDSTERDGQAYNTVLFPVNTPNVNSFMEANTMPNEQTTRRNKYLVIQDVCDETSMVAYNLIGHMLEEFAKTEGSDLDWSDSLYLKGHSAILQDPQAAKEKQTSFDEDGNGSALVAVVEELLPSLPKSSVERLKELMEL